jgi:signal transduction histidine kinase
VEEATQHVTAILNSANALRDYIEQVQKPVIYRLKQEGKLDPEFFDPKILSASYITRHVLANYIRDNNISYQFKMAATNPRNPVNKADSFEAGILQKFRSGSLQSYSTILDEGEKKYFFHAIPIARNRASCMRCHSTPERAPKKLVALYGPTAGFGEKIGEMRALISLKVPLESIIDQYMRDYILSLLILFVLLALFYLLFFLLHKKDRKIRQEQEERDRLLEEANSRLSQRIEEEIERRLKQERELNEKERLLTHQSKLAGMGEMIGNIAHQWRQPLTQLSSILINLELQQEYGKLSSEKLREKIAEANEQIQYMSGTIDDFRNFFAPEKHRESYRISRPLENARKLLAASLKNNEIDLVIEVEEDFLLEGYPNEMAQALLNILSNAKDILLERDISDARIVVRACLEHGKKTLSICDNAGGVAPHLIDKIFEPYFSTKHASTGTGVGLYMTKTIIEKHHHGTITVENTENGACFRIVFSSD